jgi:plastocyanin
VEAPPANWTLDESSLDNWTPEDWTSAGTAALEASPLQVAPGSGAVMEFGNIHGGSPFPPAVHDESYHGADRIIPSTVVIDAHQAVTFHVLPGHRVAIYKPGKRPEDIFVNPNSFFILDADKRQALQSAPVPVLSFTFHNPGTYLIICAVRRHFVDSNMYGWVHVR